MTTTRFFYGTVQPFGPLPTWFADPASPYGSNEPGTSLTPPPEPGTSLVTPQVYDTFARANQNFFLQAVPSLGTTEAGSRGPLPWHAGTVGPPIMTAPFGIIAGRAVFLERQPA